MSLNSRSRQISAFLVVCGYEHLPVNFLIHRPELIFESSLENKNSSPGGRGLFCQVSAAEVAAVRNYRKKQTCVSLGISGVFYGLYKDL